MNFTTKDNTNELIEYLINLSLNHNMGVFIRHIINHKFDGPLMYKYFAIKTNFNNIVCIAGNTKSKVMNEVPVIQIYNQAVENNIKSIQANFDNNKGDFYAHKQTNQDFLVNIKTAFNNVTPPHILRPQDEKAGMGIFKHATCGTLGLLTYDATIFQLCQHQKTWLFY